MEIKPGFIHFQKDRIGSLRLLKSIYEFESERVSGPGSSTRDIRKVLWSTNQISEDLDLDDSEKVELKSLISYLVDERQMMKIPKCGDSPERYISRMAETVRLLGHTYEYWHRGRPGIDAVRWLIEEKKIPDRRIKPEDFISEVQRAILNLTDLASLSENLRSSTEIVVRGIATDIAKGKWKEARFSQFQLDSTISTLNAFYGQNPNRIKGEVITAGVGAGKTLAFAIPCLISAVEGIISGGDSNRRCFLLVYPRKALAQDQMKTIKGYVEKIDCENLAAHFEHSSQYHSVKRGLEEKYGKRGPPPDIIVTTFETLKRRLQHPLFIKKIAEHLSCVILDEIHLAEGLSGAHISMLMNRLRQASSARTVFWIAASATIARPDEHASRIFGIPPNKVGVISPNDEDLITIGLAHHAFLRPSGAISNLGALINATSILVHSRRGDIGATNSTDDRKRPKTLAFADNLDTLGRWNADLRENERTDESPLYGERTHPRGPDMKNPKEWDRKQRELPYAQRFRRPLERRLGTKGGKGLNDDDEESFEEIEIPGGWKEKHICSICMKGERKTIGLIDRENLKALSKIVYRWPHDEKEIIKAMRIQNPIFEQEETEIGTLDLCPYLQAGACIWFNQESDEEPDERMAVEISERDRIFEWRPIAKSTIHSSKRNDESSDIDGDLADIVFKDTVRNVYGVGSLKDKVPIDIVLASPSLEVGIDLPMLTESIMTNAIRNVASYRQKAGRIGREPGLDVMNVVLISDSPIDLHYYRQPRKLTSLGQLDPIPLKDRNLAVQLCGLYLSAWDWLALMTDLPEAIPIEINRNDGKTSFSAKLRESLEYLKSNRSELAKYLEGVSRNSLRASSEVVNEVITQTINEFELLLTDASGTFRTIPEIARFTAADLMIYILAGNEGKRIELRLGREIEPFYQEKVPRFEVTRKRINSIPAELRSDFDELDRMRKSEAWNPERLKEIQKDVANLIETGEITENREEIVELANEVLPSLSNSLANLVSRGHDPRMFAIYEHYRDLVTNGGWKPYYLSTVMQLLPIMESIRLRPWFVRPENLFSNPYEPFVRLRGDAPDNQKDIPVSEALFGYVPGTWSYRIPHECFKIRCGKINVGAAGQSTILLSSLNESGNSFVIRKKSLPSPPGIQGQIDIYRPVEVSLMRVKGKYIVIDRRNGSALDKDEGFPRGGSKEENGDSGYSKRVKIPRSFLSKWVHVDEPQGEAIAPYMPEDGDLIVEGEKRELSGREALGSIKHPLFARHIGKIDWHDHLVVTEYLYSVDRAYSGLGNREGIELNFRDRFGPIGFGDYFDTEGLSITLNNETIKELLEEVKTQMKAGKKEWAPSILKAFDAYLSRITLRDGGSLSPFMVEDISGLVLTETFDNEKGITFEALMESLTMLLSDSEKRRDCARKFYSRRYGIQSTDYESIGSDETPSDSGDIDARIARFEHAAEEMTGALSGFEPFLEEWIRFTLLNTFGVVALTALQEFSGARDHDIGYAIDPKSKEEAVPRIFLYDRAAFGNGCSSTARRYSHILHILRHGATPSSKSLPTDDYLSLLEERLLQCPQFHIDMSALAMHENSILNEHGIKGLGDVEAQAKEVLKVSKDVWNAIGVSGLDDAWKIPLANATQESISERCNIEIDDITRATTICWNGCPECVDRSDLVTGGLAGRHFLDKSVLDAWFAKGRKNVEEYVNIDFNRMAAGRDPPDIGALTRVRLDLEQPNKRRLRAVHVPWTIGFEIDRSAMSSNAHIVMRTSDILGLKLSDSSRSTGTSVGVGSVGFKRLLWFDLIMTAYLDVLDLLEDERKEIKLVYYDCRDINFDDIGLSSRMVDAILSEIRKTGMFNRLERLSDMMTWLLHRGFRISICVDKKKSQEGGVRRFLQKLQETNLSNIRILTRNVEGGNMHKKALQTPIAVLKGSANLTQSGAGQNEEIIDHFFFGTEGYVSLKANIEDTFYGSEQWSSAEQRRR